MMKIGKWIVISAILACIGLTLWQFNSIKIIAHEYWSVKKYHYYTKEGWRIKKPVIHENIAKYDLEASAIINFIYRRYSTDDDLMQILSENISRFPENQYFLYELAKYMRFGYEQGLDPDIMLKLADRLIQLDNSNANYHYLKAYVLLQLREGNNFNDVIDAVNHATKCKNHKEPYFTYKNRIIAIAQKQHLPKSMIHNLQFMLDYSSFVRDLYEALLQYENFLIIEKDFAKSDEIANVLTEMLPDKFRGPVFNINRGLGPLRLYGVGAGIGRWLLPQEIELQLRDLPKMEADKKRLEMCAIGFPDKKIEFVNEFYNPDYDKRIFGIALLPFLFYVRTAFIFLFIFALLKTVSLLSSSQLQTKTSKTALIRYLIFMAIFSISFMMPMLISIKTCCFDYQEFILLKPLNLEDLKDLLDAPKKYLICPFIPFALVFCFGIISFFKKGFDNIVTRFISAVLLAIPLGLATLPLQGNTYLKYLPFLIFLFFAFKYSFRKISAKNIFKTFTPCHDKEISVLRNNLLKFSFISFILCWLGLLAFAYPSKLATDERPAKKNVYSYSFTDDNESVYQYLLNRIEDKSLPMSSVLRTVPLIKIDDLPAFMQNLKDRKFKSTSHFFNFPPYSKKEYDQPNDCSLTYLLRTAARDQMPVILQYLNNPDNDMALVFRAQLGDKSVKPKLQTLLDNIISDPNWDQLAMSNNDLLKPRESQVVFAMAAVSEPDEAFELIKHFYERHMAEDFFRVEFDAFCTLPKEVILEFHNFYLDNALKRINDPTYDQCCLWISPFYQHCAFYLDNQTVTKILKLILMKEQYDRQTIKYGIESYISPDSIDLLRKGLQSKNKNLRAWSISQLRKLNYKFTADELKTLAEDKSWQVRANLAIYDKKLIKNTDSSPFVKLIKSF